jgi:CheY-like chemotaxis protein/HPt (histidine-containing phosphotransfer) domain-containing protein
MNSRVEFESELNKGSHFYFTLELPSEKEPIQAPSASEDLKPLANAAAAGNLRSEKPVALIVEDNELNLVLCRTLLAKLYPHYTFISATSGYQAIEMVEKHNPEFILMDIQMPYLDGMATAKIIRESLNMDIPIIALTANASLEDETKYTEAGMNDYIAKPFKREELFTKIYRQLKKHALSKIEENTQDDSNAQDLYSLKNIEAISQGDQQFVRTIIDTFKTNTPNYLEEIVKGIQTADFAKIKHASHQMKPSFDILEIESVRQTVRDIETESASATPNIEKIKNDFEQLHAVVLKVVRHMESIFNDR